MGKKKPLKTYRVKLEYTVRGEIEVEASSIEEANDQVHEEMICPSAGCEIVDWNFQAVERNE